LTEQEKKDFQYKCIWCGKKITITKNSSAYVSKSKTSFGADENGSGKMIWCKECVNKQYDEYLYKYNNVYSGIYYTCRRFDIPFFPDKVNWVASQLEDDNFKQKAFEIYMQKVFSLHWDEVSVCFDDGATIAPEQFENIEGEENRIKKWGNFGTDDLDFLDYELEDWQKTHSCDNKAELTLLKQICIKELDIRKMQADHQDTSKALKDLQDLMKTASVDPAKANAASIGKSVDAFGVWVKDIEEKRPAEWFEDQEKYKDMDGFGTYLKNYVWRPIENFLTGARNFFVNDNLDVNLDTVDLDSVEEDDSDA
jgi:hypothetical protein